jgi:tRNA(Ile2) C34 agmatinyltransferase TiaS
MKRAIARIIGATWPICPCCGEEIISCGCAGYRSG